MQVFELHFNPKIKEDQLFDSFIYEPTHSSEKKLGSLYLLGELKNSLPQNSKFLDNLAQIIKENYYKISYNSAEKALSQDLKKANDFLAEEVKKENVSWLGNLNFGALSIKDFDLSFSKTGELKVLLIRNSQIIDIGKNLDNQDIEPYPLKVFFNVVSGKMAENDVILVLTKSLFDFFAEQNITNRLASAPEINKKTLEEIIPPRLFNKGAGKEISGICLVASFGQTADKKYPRDKEGAIVFRKEEDKFSFSEIFSPLISIFNKIKGFKKPVKILEKPKDYLKRKINLKAPVKLLKSPFAFLPSPKKEIKKQEPKEEIVGPSGSFLIKDSIKKPGLKIRIILIIILIGVLFAGFLIFKKAEQIKENKIILPLDEIEEKINLAESFLIINKEKEAESLFKEVWSEITILSEKKTSSKVKSRISSLKNSIEEHLNDLNKLEQIEPEESSKSEYQKWSDPLSPPESFINQTGLDFDLFALYLSNLYFLDPETCKITKYSLLGTSAWSGPKTWKEPDEYCSQPKSITIDGSIWILNNNNSIVRYYKSQYQETIELDIFPNIENITKIKTKAVLPYLYLLEPVNNRLIIIDKETKEIIKQFQSSKFDNLKDFSISENGEIVYVLNDDKVYKIEI